MLVLSRKRNEVVMIGHDVTLTIVEVRGDKVRIGIEAPRDLPVHRLEVYEAIQRSGGVDRKAPKPEPAEQSQSSSAGDAPLASFVKAEL